ncbi:hybrid sensor histidine kinase/response regulator transcription factor [Parabacteroides faecis]|uniref:histidine kinase n=1 Tax=Parabacteroides faecis TaxID=1217282 RepID=A0ABR6KGJ3_9BACT|nr:two-component regulator propeller domain-containing protein [Parabacteroides faecis]MBB4620627.1 signal transduction histidine kinase/DNA-binding response OmpR family regulator/ligand-binding sensor domain-containing protein [Parabacteroides faecis]GGK06290.1 hybrid sensor histidine kinase/response regulator [Parabacteroides faecis]
MRKTIILFIFLHVLSYAFPIYFKHIGMKEGLSQLSVMSIYQDELGRMWFGTEEGLSVFDGVHVTTHKPTLKNETNKETTVGNSIDFITGDNQGNIYFNSDNSLVRYNLHTQQFSCLKQSGVTAVAFGNDRLWVGVADSVFIWDPQIKELQFCFKLEYTYQHATCIFVDSQKQCWIGTNAGLYMKEENKPLASIILNEDIYGLFEDSHANLWISARMNGLYKRETSGNFKRFRYDPQKADNISSNQVRGIVEDNFGNLWIGTFTGLNKYNPHNDHFQVYTRDNLPGSLAHSSVFPVYKDRQGSIWLGTYYGGVHYFNPEMDLFTFYTADKSRNDCVSFPFVGHMAEDKDENIWICTEGGGLNLFDRQKKTFTYFMADPDKNSIAHDNLKDIAYSAKRNKLYIGTHTGGLSIFDIPRKQFRNPYFEDPSYAVKAGDRINQMTIWKDKYLVFLTQWGSVKMDLDTEHISPVFPSGKQYGNHCFAIDSNDYIWITSGRVIYKINMEDEEDKTIFRCGENGLGDQTVTTIYEDKKGRLFFGTSGAGLYLYDKKNNSFKGYTTENSMILSNYCYEIEESLQGYLIISGDKGLSFFDPEQSMFKVVELGTALPVSGINKGCGLLVCKNGEIFVGGIDGLSAFFEQDLFRPSKDYQLYFSDLYINNEPVYPKDQSRILSEALPYTQEIHLNHNQNNLILNFNSNNYINTLKETAYEYKLEGFDTKWISNSDNSIQYTNLNPGEYTLIVREKQYDTKIEPQTIRMGITIHSPFYATPLFYLLYVLVGGGLIYGFFRFKQSQLLLRTSLQYERKEKERIEELNQAKLQFFSNISHEFRTPLTLIISQIELLLQSSSLAPSTYNKLLKIYRNTHSMRALISELLDFRKLEQGHVKLKVYEQNIVPFLKEIYLSFYEYASSRSITYLFTSEKENINCWFDPKQMQKVFYNLLSNAFKYTKPRASIEMVIEENENTIIIKIIDNGIGINKEDINKIFDRFYQAGNQTSDTAQPSTGIGLSLTKSIIELHHGKIQVESTPGYGSIFIVLLPKDRTHFKEEECQFVEPDNETIRNEILPESIIKELPESTSELSFADTDTTYTVLLVDDNEELLQILNSLFSPVYKVLLAHNGKEGLEIARNERPDIIISDIMMPEMSGTEMCLKIKNDFDICHIPVILLTALSSTEQSIEGLQRGADDYISKPFNAKVLLARCNNLVRNRIILQKKFNEQKDFDTQSLASNPIDQKFMDTINKIIEENLNNMEFDMNTLAKELGLSRSSLYAKFKALTGMTPNDFVLNCKLKRAATLLTGRPDLQIAEISDMLGFGSPRYFTRCFKAQFDTTPAEYRKKTGKME